MVGGGSMTTSVSHHRRRRTQAERSAATREALLDATVACLIEDGYANMTTSRVAERAGVSRGAHLHHFQTRSALVAAAIKHLSWRRGRELHAAAEDLPDGEGRVAAALDLLWTTYSSPLFAAALDLWTHARTDPELREHLVAVDRALDAETLGLARRLFPDAAPRPDFERLVESSLATIRGLALMNMLDPAGGGSARQWPYTRDMLVRAFAEG